MPSLQELERFQASFQNLGNEREIREKRGDPMPNSPLPGEGLDEDLAALLEDAPGLEDLEEETRASRTSAGSPSPGGKDEASPFDAAFLDTSDYSDLSSETAAPAPGNEADSEAAPDVFDPDSLDFGAFLDSIPDDLTPIDDNGIAPDDLSPIDDRESARDAMPPPNGGIVDGDTAEVMPPDFTADAFGTEDFDITARDGLVDSEADPGPPGFEELEELGELEESGDMADGEDWTGASALVDEDAASLPESRSLTGPNAPDDGFSLDDEDFSLPPDTPETPDIDDPLPPADEAPETETENFELPEIDMEDFGLPKTETGDSALPDAETGGPGLPETDTGYFNLPSSDEFNLDDSLDLFSEEPAPGLAAKQRRTAPVAADEDFAPAGGDFSLPGDDFGLPADDFSAPSAGNDDFAVPDSFGNDRFDNDGAGNGAPDDAGIDSFSLPEDFSGDFDTSDESPFAIPELDTPTGEIALTGEDSGTDFDGAEDAGAASSAAAAGTEDPFAAPLDDDAEVALDSFDTFSLDNDLASGFGLKNDDATDGEGFADLEDFSLDGIDALFTKDGAPGKAPPPQRPGRAAKSAKSSVGEEEISLTEDDFEKLEKTLDSYPLNLRMACEEIIAEQIIPADQMANLVRLLVSGASPGECAQVAGKILSRSIVVPKGFEKKSGEALEEEQSSFGWLFRNRILPVIKIGAFVSACAALLVFMGYQFVWRPVAANALYKKGWELIPQGAYSRSRERFDAASRIQRQKKWHYRYAESYIEKRQYELARQMYDETLTFYRRDKKASLDYARMESERLRNYERADRILRAQILDWKVHDREGLLAQGDNFLAWGEIDRSKYERARESFATLIEVYGPKDPFMERMLRYFIRTDSLADTLALQEHFMGSKRRDIGHETLAELGAYLIDKKEEEPDGVPDPNLERIANIGKIFERAIEQDPEYPESWYHLYRYQLRYGAKGQGLSTIQRAVELFDRAEERNASRKYQHIDAIRRYAAHLAEERSFLPAAEQLVKGAELYEDALERRILAPTAELARVRADLGDLDYFVFARHDEALSNYERAVRDGWAPPEIRYRMGYIHYSRADWRTALEHFYDASMDLPLSRKLLFAMANTAANQGNQHMAQGYYNQLLDILELERSRFPRLVPAGSVEHAELAERIMRARNNLGVTMEELARQSGRTDYRSRALSLLSESARAWDALTRDPESMVRTDGTNLGYLNTKMILQPALGFAPQIYQEIDKDVLEPSAWEELVSD